MVKDHTHDVPLPACFAEVLLSTVSELKFLGFPIFVAGFVCRVRFSNPIGVLAKRYLATYGSGHA